MFRIGCLVDKGVFREKNDDRATVGSKIVEEGYYETVFDKEYNVVVFDGVGGEKNGDVAAQIAAQHFADNHLPLSEDELEALLQTTNEHILNEQKNSISNRRMSTTVAGVIIKKNSLIVFNVGDSDVYCLRNGFISLVSQRHTMVAMLGTAVENTKEIPEHMLTRYLGGKYSKPYLKTIPYPLLKNDCYVLCTDGISDCISCEEFEDIIARNISIKEKCIEINRCAKINGSRDNMTIIIVQGD